MCNTEDVKVSVVMPMFNAEKWIKESIDSILGQTYKNIELIVVDDCSTDQSRAIVEEYATKDSRVRLLLNNKNLGNAESFNIGVAGSFGQYIARMDADDISFLDRIESQVEYMDAHPNCGVLGAWVYRMRKKGDVVLRKFPEQSSDLKLMLIFESCFVNPVTLMRKSVLDQLEYVCDKKLKTASDYDLWSRLTNICDFHCLQKPLLYYREHDASVSMSARRKIDKKERVNKIQKNLLESLDLASGSFLDIHQNIVHKQKRYTLSPSVVDAHIDLIFLNFNDSVFKTELKKKIQSSLSKNLVYLLRRLFNV